MKTRPGPDAYGYTIFCEDIRAEVGGTLTYVGVFKNQIRWRAGFPSVLPRLTVEIVYIQQKSAFIPPKGFFIFLPGDEDDNPSITAEMPADVAQKLDRMSENADEDSIVTARFRANFAGLPLAKPGLIKVRAERDGELIRLGALRFAAQRDEAGAPT